MIYMWFTGINYFIQTVEKDCNSISMTVMTIWKPGFTHVINQQQRGHFLGHPVYAGNLVENHQWIFYNNKRLYINE
jgi:hypothetical protein